MQVHEIQPLVDKLKELPPERLAEVENFIDFLRSRLQVKRAEASQRESPDFPVISVGQWPADLSLRREDMYGDDGR
jgi:hypothetical protein